MINSRLTSVPPMLIILTIILFSVDLYAGPSWNSNTMLFERSEENALTFEAGLPEFKDDSDEKITGQIYFLALNYLLNNNSRLIAEIPFVVGKIETDFP